MMENSEFKPSRRTVLQSTGLAGIAALGSSVSAAQTNSQEVQSNIIFGEMGIEVDIPESVGNDYHYDSHAFYHLTQDDLLLHAIKRSDLEKFVENEAVVRYNKYRALRDVITRKDHSVINSGLNKNLDPTGGIVPKEPIQTPAIRLDYSGDVIHVAIQGEKKEISPNELKEIEIDTTELKSGDGKSFNANINAIVKNHGEVNVTANNIVGGNK